jgi:hypothetical protein
MNYFKKSLEYLEVFRHFCQIAATVYLNRKCTLEANMWCTVVREGDDNEWLKLPAEEKCQHKVC